MRIVAGMWRGRRIEEPRGREVTRPTTDRVREACASVLDSALDEGIGGARVLDAFAGFDAVLIDPPYALGPEPAEALLEALAAHSLLASGAIALFEHRSDLPGAHPQGFEIVREKRYGTTAVDVLQLVDETN